MHRIVTMPKPRHTAPSAQRAVPRKSVKIPSHAIPGTLAERRWKLVQRELRYYWRCLSDEDVLQIAGRRDELLRILHEKYSYTRARADRELDAALSASRDRKK